MNPPVYPLLWSDDAAAIADWAVRALGLTEVWRVEGREGQVEHAELTWHGGRVSINERQPRYDKMGHAGIALSLGERDRVDETHRRAVAAVADVIQGPEESYVAYSFTALDPDGNQWWVHAETGNLDALRG